MRRSKVVAATVSLMSVAALAGAGAAHAAFPGTNGLIAYPSGGALFTVDPAIFPPVTQRLTKAGVFNAVNFSADGKMLAASETAGIVFLEPKPGATIVPLPGGDASDRNPSFDPTGTRITFQNANDIFVQNVDGTGRANLTSAFANNVNQPDWSPDGQFIAFEDDTDAQIKKISVTDGTITTLTPPAANCAAGNPCQEPNWAPDGLTVAYDVDAVNPGIYEIA